MPVAKQPAVSPDAEVAKESPASSVLGRLADAALKGILLYFAVQITLNCTFQRRLSSPRLAHSPINSFLYTF